MYSSNSIFEPLTLDSILRNGEETPIGRSFSWEIDKCYAYDVFQLLLKQFCKCQNEFMVLKALRSWHSTSFRKEKPNIGNALAFWAYINKLSISYHFW